MNFLQSILIERKKNQGGRGARVSDLFYIEPRCKKILRGGGGGEGSRVSEFFLTKNQNLK